MIKITDSVSKIKGIGPKKLKKLEKLKILSVEELLHHMPVRYQDRRVVKDSNQLVEGREQLTSGVLLRKMVTPFGRGKSLLACTLSDDKGSFRALFFNMPFLSKHLKIGERYTIFGKCQRKRGIMDFNSPEMHLLGSEEDLRGIFPIYRCTAGITSRDFIRWIQYALNNIEFEKDWIPEEIRQRRTMCDIETMYRNLHFPASERDYRIARSRFVYEQLYLHQSIIAEMRRMMSEQSGDSSIPEVSLQPFLDILPFELTEGQQHAIEELNQDLGSTHPMNRLIQGDVGCGKTVVAEAGMYRVAINGAQSVLMVPTEILARQHYVKISADFAKLGISCELLVGTMKAADKRAALTRIEDGTAQVIIGTHAVIQSNVNFHRLELVITDEQHRFGVAQRRMLADKTSIPNVLVMTATPIPRTMAATVYGDMDFSIIRSLPAMRKPIITRVAESTHRAKAYAEVLREMKLGNRAYIVAPSIEDNSKEIASTEKLYEELRRKLSPYKVSLLHGKMTPEEKEHIMEDFANGDIDALIATVVVEVGIDVPEATIMVVENADRFGLAQLHQLRGRVGRSERQSYCWLINYSANDTARERLQILQENIDGFAISEEDYRLRGAGDIHGTMQHGAAATFWELYRYENILEYVKEDIARNSNVPISPEIKRRMNIFLQDDFENTI
jgi:ATP-dependent DNA helicase RecG